MVKKNTSLKKKESKLIIKLRINICSKKNGGVQIVETEIIH